MNQVETPMTEKESLELIASMIRRAKDACHDTGVSAIMWGALIAFCSLEKLAEIQFAYQLPVDIFLLTFVAVIPQILIKRREKKMKKVKSWEDEFQAALWITFGICIFVLIFILNVMLPAWSKAVDESAAATGRAFSFRLYEYTSSLFLMLYGMPTFITGKTMKFRPMLLGGVICWLSAIGTLFTPIKADLALIALAAIVAWLIPGIILEREYRKAKKQLAQQDV